MTIELINNFGYTLQITDENVCIVKDIEERIYPKEDGKTVFNKGCKRDIMSKYIKEMSKPLEDMLYYREEPIDTSDLIEQCFEKLPEGTKQSLLTKLNKKYEL